MVQYVIKRGRRIKLLPPPPAPEEDGRCAMCKKGFGAGPQRRACFDLCGHVACLGCLLSLKEECVQCRLGEGSEQRPECSREVVPEKTPVLVISSVLSHFDEEENIFPDIKHLTISLLPVLDRAEELPVEKEQECYVCEEEEEEGAEGTPPVPKLEVQRLSLQRCSATEPLHYIPVIDLCQEEDKPIPLVDLTEDEKEAEVAAPNMELRELYGAMRDAAQNSCEEEEECDESVSHEVEDEELERRSSTENFVEEVQLGERLEVTGVESPIYPRRPRWFFEQGAYDNRINEQLSPGKKNVDGAVECEAVRPLGGEEQKENILGAVNGRRRVYSRHHRLFGNKKYLEISRHPRVKKTYEKLFPCDECRKRFTTKNRLANHVCRPRAEKRSHPCDLCGGTFSSKRKLHLHYVAHKQVEQSRKRRQYGSLVYRKSGLQKQRKRMAHRKQRPKIVSEVLTPDNADRQDNQCCPCCRQQFENETAVSIHLKLVHGVGRLHMCDQCGSPFTGKKQLAAHVKTHVEQRSYFPCVMCKDKFTRRYGLERHMVSVHGIRLRLQPEETPQGEEYCPECQSLFGTEKCTKVAYSVCGHISCMECVIRAELGCGQCTTENASKKPGRDDQQGEGEAASMEGSDEEEVLETSKDSTNVEPPPIQEKPTRRRVEVTRRVRKPIRRQYTVRKSIMYRNKIRKRRRPTAVKVKPPKIHSCQYCTETFEKRRDLGLHMQYMHRDLRPYPCDYCQWPFSAYRDLERHRVCHTDQRPFKCKLCFQGFNWESALKRHLEKLHSDYVET